MPLTFTQGTMRYAFKYHVDHKARAIVQLAPAVPINVKELVRDNILVNQSARGTFCVGPTAIRQHVSRILVPVVQDYKRAGGLIKWIYEVFGDQTTTILWCIGDMLADFGEKQMMIFFGPGEIGKTTVANLMTDIVSCSVCNILGRYFVIQPRQLRNYGNTINDQMKGEMANSRVVLAGDVEARSSKDKVNMQTVKDIVSGEKGKHGALTVSIIMSINDLFTYEHISDWIRSHCVRRVIVVPTVRERKTKSAHYSVPSEQERTCLASYSITIRCMHGDRPPLTRISVLMMFFMSKYISA
jgi:hypothetical protein